MLSATFPESNSGHRVQDHTNPNLDLEIFPTYHDASHSVCPREHFGSHPKFPSSHGPLPCQLSWYQISFSGMPICLSSLRHVAQTLPQLYSTFQNEIPDPSWLLLLCPLHLLPVSPWNLPNSSSPAPIPERSYAVFWRAELSVHSY